MMGDAVPMPKPKEPWSAETTVLCIANTVIIVTAKTDLFDLSIMNSSMNSSGICNELLK